MYRNIDVMTEVRKIATSKPVHAAAGASVIATKTLWSLPGRIVQWGVDGTVTSLPARATDYVMTTRAKAVDGYEMLADRGKQILGGQDRTPRNGALNGTASHGTASDGTASDGTASDGTASHGTASHGTASHGTANHGTANHGTNSHSTASRSTASRSTSRNGTAANRKSSGSKSK